MRTGQCAELSQKLQQHFSELERIRSDMSDLAEADDIPITRVTDNYIWFQNKALSDVYSQGKLDRLTGALHFFHRHLNDAKDYYLRCKPAKPLP